MLKNQGMKKARIIFTLAIGMVITYSASAQDVKQPKKAALKSAQTERPVVEKQAVVIQSEQPVQQPLPKPSGRKPISRIPIKKVALKRTPVNESPEVQNN